MVSWNGFRSRRADTLAKYQHLLSWGPALLAPPRGIGSADAGDLLDTGRAMKIEAPGSELFKCGHVTSHFDPNRTGIDFSRAQTFTKTSVTAGAWGYRGQVSNLELDDGPQSEHGRIF
jgi:hypothetical protein